MTKQALNSRLSKAAGHLGAVLRMVQEDRPYMHILDQLKAVQSALNSCAHVMLRNHLEESTKNTSVTEGKLLIEEIWQIGCKPGETNNP